MPSPTPRCSSYWKESFRVTLDSSCQFSFSMHILYPGENWHCPIECCPFYFTSVCVYIYIYAGARAHTPHTSKINLLLLLAYLFSINLINIWYQPGMWMLSYIFLILNQKDFLFNMEKYFKVYDCFSWFWDLTTEALYKEKWDKIFSSTKSY